jgi:septum formation topological specificity factor MinE
MTGQQVREPLRLLLVAWPSVFDRIAERRNAKSRLRLIVELERAYQRLQKEINEVLDKQILQEVARLAEASDAIGVALDESQKQRHEIQARTVTLQRLLRARYGNDWLESAREHLGDQVFAGSAR